jgi:hypothetical protein
LKKEPAEPLSSFMRKERGPNLVIKMPDKAGIEDMQAMLKSIAEYGRYQIAQAIPKGFS